MPLITLRVKELPEALQLEMAEQLVEITCDILRKKRELTVVNIQLSEGSGRWFVAGRRSDETMFSLNISITKGSNTEREKSAWIQAAYDVVRDIALKRESVNYITINEIEADCWGYNGVTQKYRQISK